MDQPRGQLSEKKVQVWKCCVENLSRDVLCAFMAPPRLNGFAGVNWQCCCQIGSYGISVFHCIV